MVTDNDSQIRRYYQIFQPHEIDFLGKYTNQPVNSEEEFVTLVNKYSGTYDLFTAYRKFKGRRDMDNVTELSSFYVDIDEDAPKYEKTMKFEEFCEKQGLKIKTKAKSGGGTQITVPFPVVQINQYNRQHFIELNARFVKWLDDNGIDIDKKCKDLGRVIRIWGSLNIKRNKICTLDHVYDLSDDDVKNNKKIIDGIPKELIKHSVLGDRSIKTCEACEYALKNILPKTNTGFNDSLGKNICLYARGKYGEDMGLELARNAYKLKKHTSTEADGWFNRTDLTPTCNEIQKYFRIYYPDLYRKICMRCKISNVNNAVYIDDTSTPFYKLKTLYRNRMKLPINKIVLLEGIVSVFAAYKISFIVGKLYRKVDKEETVKFEDLNDNSYKFVYFDETSPNKTRYMPIKDIQVDFFAYSFVVGNNEYILLSESEIKLGEYEVEGTLVDISDNVKIGEIAKLSTKKKVLFAFSAHPKVIEYKSVEELFKRWRYSEEELNKYMFSGTYIEGGSLKHTYYEQPKLIADFYHIFLLSSKFKGYPMHTIICGPRSAGKSVIQEAVYTKFTEPSSIVDSGGSTMKGLVPSFYSNRPEIGLFLKGVRIVFLDEKFNIIKQDSKGFLDSSVLAMANNLLEHKEHYGSVSGKGSVVGAMRAKVYGCTNPIYGETFLSSMKMLPVPYLNRFLILNLPPDYLAWVNSEDHIYPSTKSHSMITHNEFLSMYDFLNSFVSDFDRGRVMRIANKSRERVINEMSEIYEGRYTNHHCLCFMDGIIKVRCLNNKDTSFKAKEEDYKMFKIMWEYIIDSWGGEIDYKLSGKLLLSKSQLVLYKYINSKGKAYVEDLDSRFTETDINWKSDIKRLLKLKLVLRGSRFYYIEQKELTLNDLEDEL